MTLTSLKDATEKLRLVGQHLEWIMGALMNENHRLWKKIVDENQSVFEVIQSLESLDSKLRDVALDIAKKHDVEIAALESRNSSALKELRKKVEAKSKTLEEVRVDLNPLSLDMKRMLLEHYDWFISEIDSLLQQEGK